MCLVVDTSCFGSVFNPKAKEHEDFTPVYRWIVYGRGGRLIYGGDKYKSEIDFRSSHYRKLLAEVQRKGRLLHIPDKSVNREAESLKRRVNDDEFDDEHIVAIVVLSRCCVVCTNDKRSIPFLQRRDLYPDGVNPPKVYQSKRHGHLCCSKHVVEICKDNK